MTIRHVNGSVIVTDRLCIKYYNVRGHVTHDPTHHHDVATNRMPLVQSSNTDLKTAGKEDKTGYCMVIRVTAR